MQGKSLDFSEAFQKLWRNQKQDLSKFNDPPRPWRAFVIFVLLLLHWFPEMCEEMFLTFVLLNLKQRCWNIASGSADEDFTFSSYLSPTPNAPAWVPLIKQTFLDLTKISVQNSSWHCIKLCFCILQQYFPTSGSGAKSGRTISPQVNGQCVLLQYLPLFCFVSLRALRTKVHLGLDEGRFVMDPFSQILVIFACSKRSDEESSLLRRDRISLRHGNLCS